MEIIVETGRVTVFLGKPGKRRAYGTTETRNPRLIVSRSGGLATLTILLKDLEASAEIALSQKQVDSLIEALQSNR